jgi:hypothetical protein
MLRFARQLPVHLGGHLAARLGSGRPNASPKDRLGAAMAWLCRAQDRATSGGVSEAFHLYHGWLPPYPETTGYIAETFWDYFQRTRDAETRDRALRMAEWLLSVQQVDGALLDATGSRRMVFDTGQVLGGFVRSFSETEDERFLTAARRAGDWLVSVQDPDGAWRRHAFHGIPHAYYARVSWNLARLAAITGDARHRDGALRNAEWTLQRQRASGWFDEAGFVAERHPRPFTHTIAYTVQGLLETGAALGEARFVTAAARALAGLRGALAPGELPAGTYDAGWRGDRRFTCLTGNVQLALCMFRLADIAGDGSLYAAGAAINRAMAVHQDIATRDLDRRGALAGSSPIWGSYIHFAYPNWATKFLADSLMAEMRGAPAASDA